jgi:hypothetical protein
VGKSSGSDSTLSIDGPYLEIAGDRFGPQLARLSYGKGTVYVAPDPLLFTNYALAQPDNAVLVSNLIRSAVPAGAPIVFDESVSLGSAAQGNIPKTLPYYLWQPPARWALLQLILAGLLLWMLVGRRMGQEVPLAEGGPVTRASQFALAMGSLFYRAGRPRAAGEIIGETFRRKLARRLGMSPAERDIVLAQRAHELSGLPLDMLDYLLLQSKAPADTDAEVLRDAQAMEEVLSKLGADR